jgi:hypothetical protein
MRAASFLLGIAVVAGCGGSDPPRAAPDPARAVTTGAPQPPPRGVRVGCDRRSEAGFPGAYDSPHNLVAGPLAMVGAGDFTAAPTVREYGGNKFPLLVRTGHTATVRVARPARLFYAGRTARTITFAACRRGGPITFWSGFVLTPVPVCARDEVFADAERFARRRAIALGKPCR